MYLYQLSWTTLYKTTCVSVNSTLCMQCVVSGHYLIRQYCREMANESNQHKLSIGIHLQFGRKNICTVPLMVRLWVWSCNLVAVSIVCFFIMQLSTRGQSLCCQTWCFTIPDLTIVLPLIWWFGESILFIPGAVDSPSCRQPQLKLARSGTLAPFSIK